MGIEIGWGQDHRGVLAQELRPLGRREKCRRGVHVRVFDTV